MMQKTTFLNTNNLVLSTILLVRIFNPQPIFARLWRVLLFFTLARGKKNKGCGQNVLTSNHSFLEPIISALKKVSVLFILLFPVINPLSAQSELTQAFRFENGVYKTFDAFQKNTPTHTGNMIEGNFFINEKTKQAKIEYIRLKGTGKNLDLDAIWGVVIRGIPYVKATTNLPAHSLKVFAAMEVRGNICYYAYDDIEEKELTFKAYNPLIGKPFRTGKAMRKLPIIKEKMLRFTTGEVADFNYQNLIEWTAEEPDIIQALKSLGPVRAEDKLFDALLLYNDKHSVTLPINQ